MFIQVSMHFPASVLALGVEIFIDEFPGTIEVKNLLCGDAVQGLRTGRKHVTLQQFKKQNFMK